MKVKTEKFVKVNEDVKAYTEITTIIQRIELYEGKDYSVAKLIAALQKIEEQSPGSTFYIHDDADKGDLVIESRGNVSREMTLEEVNSYVKRTTSALVKEARKEAKRAQLAEANTSLLAKIRAKGAPVIEFESDSIDA